MIAKSELARSGVGSTVYFQLPEALSLPTFESLMADPTVWHASPAAHAMQEHWSALEQRREGRRSWSSSVAPYKGEPTTREEYVAKWKTYCSPGSLAAQWGYIAPTVDGVRYSLDYFNPRNEFGVPYAGAGAPVLALLMESTEAPTQRFPRLVRDHLPESFYDIVRHVHQNVGSTRICGTYSIFATLAAFDAGRVESHRSPWEFLHPLHLVQGPPAGLLRQTASFSGRLVGMMDRPFEPHRVEWYGDDAALLHISPGFQAVLGWEYFAVAAGLGMTCVQQLVEGVA